jgi:predicted nucleotidyltransferase
LALKYIPRAASAEIQRFVKSIPQIFHPFKVVIFGSQIKDTAHRWSDIDIAIVSDRFSGLPLAERNSILCDLALAAKCLLIEAHGFTPAEYENGPWPVAGGPSAVFSVND